MKYSDEEARKNLNKKKFTNSHSSIIIQLQYEKDRREIKSRGWSCMMSGKIEKIEPVRKWKSALVFTVLKSIPAAKWSRIHSLFTFNIGRQNAGVKKEKENRIVF